MSSWLGAGMSMSTAGHARPAGNHLTLLNIAAYLM